MARLDLYLKNTGLFKSRSQAKQACDGGCVFVGGGAAKASAELAVGDVFRIDEIDRLLKAEVLELPERPVPRNRRAECYRVVHEERRTPRALTFDDPPDGHSA